VVRTIDFDCGVHQNFGGSSIKHIWCEQVFHDHRKGSEQILNLPLHTLTLKMCSRSCWKSNI